MHFYKTFIFEFNKLFNDDHIKELVFKLNHINSLS